MTNKLPLKARPDSFWFYGFMILLFVFASSVNAQNVTVKGKVTDVNGIPLPGVNVIVKNTSTGASTDFDGFYSISAPTNSVLEFSYLGYASQSVAVNGRATVNVSLEEDVSQLEEVVVVGYGSMERSNVTGAITTVDVGEIAKTPVPNVIEALRGQVSGLRVQRGNGQPGSGVNFTIRGINSLGEGSDSVGDANAPIIVVDGVPLPGGNLNEINPDDIESVNVIKDAGAGAIYGSSAANGVILITTKNGAVGKPTITLNASTAVNEVANRMNIMNGDEYIKYLFDSGQGSNLSSILDPNELDNYIAGNTVDWQDEMLRQGLTKNVSLAVSGGNEQIRFYMNGDLYQEDGIVAQSDYNRYSLRLNADYTPSDKIKIGARVQLTKSDSDETSNSIEDFGDFAAFIPIFNNTPLGDLYNDDGSYAKFVRDDQFQINPFFRYQESVQDRNVTRAYVNPYFEYNIVDGLKYTLNTFVESRDQFFGRFLSSQYSDGDPNQARIQQQNSTNYLVDNIINYKKDFGKHGIDATFVYGFQHYDWQQNEIFSEQLATDLLGYHGIDVSSSANQRFSWDTDEAGKFYYVGRVGYDYDSRYVLTLTLRRDGSSKFVGDNKWGYFPSASIAWNVDNEKFWDSSGVMNNLKLRLSYGELGNDRIGTYRYQSNPNVVVSTILQDQDGDPNTTDDVVEVDIVGYAKNSLANPYLKWETSKQINAGVDFGILNNRINGSVDYYTTNTEDVLLPQIIPVINGYESYIDNIGETKNWGVDVALKADVIQSEDFTWNMALSWAKDQNEIVKLSRVGDNGEAIDDPANGWFIGKDIREIYNFKFAGIWQTEEAAEAAVYNQVPGDVKYEDVNNDGAINAGDRQFLGNPTPDWYGGITNTFSYKGLELSVLFEAVQGVTRVNNFIGAFNGRNNQLAINYWTPDNPSTEFPRPGSPDWNGSRGDALKTQDASFVSLRNVSLTYNLPTKFLDKTPLKALSLYVRGNNLKYFTDYKNAYSPETGIGNYPITRTWTFGTNITF